MLIDVAVPSDRHTRNKEDGKREKNQGLKEELERMLKVKTRVGALRAGTP